MQSETDTQEAITFKRKQFNNSIFYKYFNVIVSAAYMRVSNHIQEDQELKTCTHKNTQSICQKKIEEKIQTGHCIP